MRGLFVLVALTGCFIEPAPPVGADVSRTWMNRAAGTPGPLFAPRLAYDAEHQQMLMYGGHERPTGNTSAAMYRWVPEASAWTIVCNPCMPGPRQGHGFAFDAMRRRIVVYGGTSDGMALDDVWEWDGASWTRQVTGAVTGAQPLVQLVYDDARRQLVAFGSGDPTIEVYTYDGAFQHLDTSGTEPMSWGSVLNVAAYDASAGRIVLGDDAQNGDGSSRDDAFALDGTTWTRVCDPCVNTLRLGTTVVYDPGLGATLLIGGYERVANTYAGTYAIRGTTVTKVSEGPPRRDSVGAAYDSDRDVIVMFGGNGASCMENLSGDCSETWEFVAD